MFFVTDQKICFTANTCCFNIYYQFHNLILIFYNTNYKECSAKQTDSYVQRKPQMSASTYDQYCYSDKPVVKIDRKRPLYSIMYNDL